MPRSHHGEPQQNPREMADDVISSVDDIVDIKPKLSPHLQPKSTTSTISTTITNPQRKITTSQLPKIDITSATSTTTSLSQLEATYPSAHHHHKKSRSLTYSPPYTSKKRKQSPGARSAIEDYSNGVKRSHTWSTSFLSPRSATEVKRAQTWSTSSNSLNPLKGGKMNLDINDIGMPGRSGNTRSRTKVPHSERRRVPVACDSCRHRKIKCNGQTPCQSCLKNNYACHYPPVSAKIVVEENWVERLQGRCSALERCLIEAIPDPDRRAEVAAQFGLRLLLANANSPSSDSDGEGEDASQSPYLRGQQGSDEDVDAYASFIGDSATPTFLNKIREFMRASVQSMPLHTQNQQYSLDPIQAFLSSGSGLNGAQGSANLSLPQTDPYILPHKATVISLIARFVGFLGCGTSPETMTPSGGIYHWFDAGRLVREIDSLYTSVNMGLLNIAEHSRPVDYSMLCLVNAVLALACQATASSGVGPLEVEEEAIAADAYFWRSFVPNRRTSSGDGGSLTPERSSYTPTSPHSTSDYGGDTTQQNSAYYTVTDVDYHNATQTNTTGLLRSSAPTFLPGMTFFARAKALMVNPSDAPSLLTLKTLSMLSYFCLSANRWEAAYLHIGLAVRLAVANGLHRTKHPSLSTELDPVVRAREEEERRRTFWTIYILDRLVSCLTGRPVMLSDDAIDTELPSNVEGLPSASGLRAHVQLSKIMGDIITSVYPIRRSSDAPQNHYVQISQAIQKYHMDLQAWHTTLAPELKLVNGVARERGVLWLHCLYNELLMLTSRPNLLLAIKRNSAAISSPQSPNIQNLPAFIYEHALTCTSAASSNVLLARQIQASGWVHASFTECSFIFNAGMILILSRLISSPGPEWVPANQHEEDIQYAIAFLSTLAKGGSQTAARYYKDLIDFDAAVTRFIEARELNANFQGAAMSLAPATNVMPGLVMTPPMGTGDFQSGLRDIDLLTNPEYRDLYDPVWLSGTS